jgi:hypothetical protein
MIMIVTVELYAVLFEMHCAFIGNTYVDFLDEKMVCFYRLSSDEF